ncbi:unnamed protein product [Closterium sp. Naga37s-1]|nr:unnamed protein product [Closterium sp. Naga37s-1]
MRIRSMRPLQALSKAWRLPPFEQCDLRAGITCDARGMVTRINLASRNLTGVIPKAISAFASLLTLSLHDNHLHGPLPDEAAERAVPTRQQPHRRHPCFPGPPLKPRSSQSRPIRPVWPHPCGARQSQGTYHPVQPLVAENNAQAIKDPRLDAPNDVILKLARFALSCTATPVATRPSTPLRPHRHEGGICATRPSMARILSDLIAMKEEFLGPDPDPLVVRIDSDLENRRGPTFSQEIRRANAVASEREGASESGMSVGMGSIGEMESVDSGV